MPRKAWEVRNNYMGDSKLGKINPFGSLLINLGRELAANPENNIGPKELDVIEGFGRIFQRMSYNAISTSISSEKKLDEQIPKAANIGVLLTWKPNGKDSLFQMMYMAAEDQEERDKLVDCVHAVNELFDFDMFLEGPSFSVSHLQVAKEEEKVVEKEEEKVELKDEEKAADLKEEEKKEGPKDEEKQEGPKEEVNENNQINPNEIGENKENNYININEVDDNPNEVDDAQKEAGNNKKEVADAYVVNDNNAINNSVDDENGSEFEYEDLANENIQSISREGIPLISEHEDAYETYGEMTEFRRQLIEDLATYERLLDKNEAEFTDHRVKDPKPKDYTDMRAELANCLAVLKNPDSDLDSIQEAYKKFDDKSHTYASNHREVFRSHRTAESAERYRIIRGISDLNEIHLKKFNGLKDSLQNRIAKFHKDEYDFKVGKYSLKSLPNVLDGSEDIQLRDDVEKKAYTHFGAVKQTEGIDLYAKEKKEAETKMLYDRFGRRTGMKTEEDRKLLEPLPKGKYSTKDYAVNYLAVKYIDQIQPNLDTEKVLDVNGKIHGSTFKKEVESLSKDFTFENCIKNRENWQEEWQKIEETSKELLELADNSLKGMKDEVLPDAAQRVKDAMDNNDANIFEDDNDITAVYRPVAMAMQPLILKNPKNSDILHGLAQCDEKEYYRLMDVAADFISQKSKFPEDVQKNQLAGEILLKITDPDLLEGVADKMRGKIKEITVEREKEMEAQKPTRNVSRAPSKGM